jgi:predicted anti-sigma-YlaC factor YlaD
MKPAVPCVYSKAVAFLGGTSMTCRDFADVLDQFLDGTLPAALARQLDDHLKICIDCRNYLDGYRQAGPTARAALGNANDPVPPAVPEELVKAILTARAGRK